jgi:hypothetical protein
LEEASFCSPEMLTSVIDKKLSPSYNYFVSDTFSIGLVALYAMTLINPIIAYNNKLREIDYYYIESLLRIATQHDYS